MLASKFLKNLVTGRVDSVSVFCISHWLKMPMPLELLIIFSSPRKLAVG